MMVNKTNSQQMTYLLDIGQNYRSPLVASSQQKSLKLV